ncbi:MAG: DNA-directed RNA polymerase subunit A' [Candidatus Woesearchaeota archaeon]
MEYSEEMIYKKLDKIVFGFLSPQMIKDMAAVKVVTPELYDKEGYPVDGGLMDTRMGVIDPGLKCKTCGGRLKECVGHFGYIVLARPVIHVKLVNVIHELLRSTCRECGRALMDQKRIKQYLNRLSELNPEDKVIGSPIVTEIINKMKDAKKCPHCGAKQFKISIEKPTTFLEDNKKLTPIEVRARLEMIKDEDLPLFGIDPKAARPEWMVLTLLPIPPVTTRPSITLETGERSEDDLTHKLGDIVRINQRLFENINAGAPEIIIEDLWELLQYHITTYFDNAIAQLPPARHRSGQPLKTLTERIKSKHGRIRHNLAGKRTNFSARTVISPDPMLELDEVGVPFLIATKLTVAERVTEWNKEYLKRFVINGPKNYPGSNYVIRPDGKKKKITDETKEQLVEELAPGYIVERHLLDGDVALFNRQPSLHRMSMMAHRVKILPYKTFRLNPAVCHPYNADFDGDEMNLHIPQTEEARAEAEFLMRVNTQIISPRYGLSVIGCIQDSIAGNYLLTKELELPREEALQILYESGVDNLSKLPNKKRVTGKEVFSVILPDDFNYVGKSKSGPVIIKNGILEEGVMDKSSLGVESGLMLRSLHTQYGKEETFKIIGQIFRLGINVLLHYGMTTLLSDIDLPKEARERINEILNSAENEVRNLIEKYKNGELKALPGRTLKDTLEINILEILNKARNDCGDVIEQHASKETSTMLMIKSGARGKLLNLIQMAAVVGQQALRGKRIEKGYSNRTLSHFKKDDLGPEAHGFIRSNFREGMNPKEFFFAAITGRDSLMDTALRTPKSGYLYRRLANALQDLKVEYDYTVRDSNNRIIQFLFGEDGIDVSKSEHGKLNVGRIVREVLEK